MRLNHLFPIVCIALGLATPAKSHDVYPTLKNARGTPCCGGDPVTGDCEPLSEGQFKVNADQSVVVWSNRYQASVKVAAEKVTWLPVAGSDAPGHWCGKPSSDYRSNMPDQIDDGWYTFCMFIAPGGV